jgi:hypothetical protein
VNAHLSPFLILTWRENPSCRRGHIHVVDQDHLQLVDDLSRLEPRIVHLLHVIVTDDLLAHAPTLLVIADIRRVQEAGHHTTIDLEVHRAGVVALDRDRAAHVFLKENVGSTLAICLMKPDAAIFGT